MEDRRTDQPRRGLTLLELLVSISIVAILFSLLLPALAGVRERARMVQCKNHLHQIGIALANYESTFGVFPNRLPDRLWALSCPSDDAVRKDYERSYYFSYGSITRDNESDGFATGNLRVYRRARDITDGLSQTVALSEKLVEPHYVGQSGLDLTGFRHDWLRLNLPGSVLARAAAAGRVESADQAAELCEKFGAPPVPMQWETVGAAEYTHVLPPNSLSCNHHLWHVISATSAHTGGVHVMLADGAVRFVNERIERRTWRALGTRAGAEVLTGDF